MRLTKANPWTGLRPVADSRSRGSFADAQCAAGPTILDSNEGWFVERKVQSLPILLFLLFSKIGILSALFISILAATNSANGAGLTIVTHGFAAVLESKRPAWVSAMANDIAAVANKNGGNAAIYEMELARSTDFPFPVRVISFSLKSGQPPQQNPNSEVIVEVYWNRLANNILVIGANSTEIATAVVPFLANATSVPDLPKPLAQLPIHLIGHSRGGSVVSEISRLLGQNGIWVDQVTTLDPHPVCFGETDADVGTYETVLYADNYYQRISGSPLCGAPFPNGVTVGGARERQLLFYLNGGYDGANGDHSDVHLWYHGTVDTSRNASDGEKTIYDAMRDTWYLFSENGGKRAGFYYSRLGGGTVSSLDSGYYNNGDFNNSPANRFSLNRQSDEWPSLITLTHNSTSSVKAGNLFPVRCVFQSYDSGCSVEFYLDTDQNPYNNGEILLPINQSINPQPKTERGTRTIDANVTVPFGTASRSYYVYGKIVNPNGTRYRYSLTQVRVDSAAPSPFIITATTQTPNGAPTITIRTVTKSDPGVTYTIYRDGTTFNFSGTEFNNTTITPGATYHYFVRATDSAGLYTDSNTITVIAPNPGVPPNTTAPAAPEGLTVNPAPWSRLNQFSVSWANPTHARNIVKVWYWIGNTPPGAGQGISRSLPQGNPLQVALPMQQGSSTIYVWLQDDQGNVSPGNYNSTALNLDPNAPIITPTIIPVSTSVSSAISINGTSSDDFSGIAGVTWVNDLGGNGIASVVKSVNGLSATWSVSSVQLTSGVNRIKLTVTDNAGNAGHSTVTVNYFDTSNSGSLGVGIQPQGAVDAGAQWRLAGETVWRAPNIAVSGIPTGNQLVEFKAVDGWITPLPATINVLANLTVILDPALGTYGSGTVNLAPDVPSNPYPLNGAVNVPRSGFTMTWLGSHPTGSPDFAVKFGTENPPPFRAGFGTVPGRTYNPTPIEPLLPGTTYYWGVRGKVRDQTTDGPIWRFTTEYSYADLIPYEIVVAGNIEPGATVTVRVKVKNQGTFSSAASCWLNLYLSRTPLGRERRISQLNTLLVPVLAPGAEAELQQSVKLDNLPAGQSFIDAWVDSANYGVNENGYDNNVQSLAINYIDGKNPVVTEARLASAIVKTAHSNSIVYFAADDVGIKTVDFYYSSNSGLDWTPIAEGYVPPAPPTYGAVYPWLVPANLPAGSNLLVRVVARDASGNSGETNAGPYLIRSGTAPMVTVLSPNGGELWNMGSQQQISWNLSAPNGVAQFSVYFYNNNTIDVLPVPLPSGNGTYTWTLRTPFSATNGLIRIMVTDLNGNTAEDYSDGVFSVRDTSAAPPAPWIDPFNITTNGANNPVTSARIATDAAGNVHLAYLSTIDAGSDPRIITHTIRYKKRTGSVWSVPQTVYSVVQQTDGNLTGYFGLYDLGIAASASGSPHIVWTKSYNAFSEQNKADVFYSGSDGSTWSQPQNLSQSVLGGYATSVLSWQTKANCPTTQAYEGAVVNNKLYVFANGGATYEFNSSLNQWTTKATAPGGISSDGAAEVNGLIYNLNITGSSIQIYNPADNSWNTGASIPTSRDGMCIVAADGKVYAIGGANSKKVEAYDPVGNSWSLKADMPTARQYAAAAVVNNKIYVIGGSGGGNQLSTVEVYDPMNNTWASIPQPAIAQWPVREQAVAVALNNRIYLMGGRRSNVYQKTVDEFDPATSSWQPMSPMSVARGTAIAGVIQSQIVIVGGSDGVDRIGSTEAATMTGSVSGAISGSPTIVVDSSDKTHVAWQDGRYIQPDANSIFGFSSVGQTDIYHATKPNGQSWSSPSRLTTSSSRSPTIAVGGGNFVHLAYVAGSSIGYRRWDGASWSTEMIAATEVDSFPRLAANTNNQLHLVWRFYDSAAGNGHIQYSYFGGSTWTPKELVGAPGSVLYPTVGVDSYNRPHVTWEDSNYPNKLYYSGRDSGAWSPRVQVNRDTQVVQQNSSSAALVTASNELHVVWNAGVNGNTEVLYNHANVGATNDIFGPSVSVTAPVLRANLSIGASFPIQWNATDNTAVTSVSLHYSTDNGSSWLLIATNQANNGTFAWPVPNLGTNAGQIRVIARDAAGNSGFGFSGTFTTIDLTPPTIALTTPVAGATLTGDASTNISWSATDNVGVVRIDLEFSLDNGATWLGMVTNLANTGTYPWTVPSVPTSTLLLRATAQDAAGFSATFTSQPITIIRGNSPPLAPASPFPLDGSSFVLTQLPNFRWNGSDPDGDALTYYVRFGSNTNAPLILTTTNSFFSPPALRPQRTYYWQVIASDGKATNTGPFWSFTTEAGTLPPTSLAEFKRQTNGQFEFRFNGLFGENQVVQASTNLFDWFTVATFGNSNAASVFLDSAATNLNRRFYRVITP